MCVHQEQQISSAALALHLVAVTVLDVQDTRVLGRRRWGAIGEHVAETRLERLCSQREQAGQNLLARGCHETE
jgi:hypothetical protein